MKTVDLLSETYVALSANKVRTALTMLGIIIGIGSVIAMIAIGQGAQASIAERIQSIGSNLIQVQPGTQRGFGGSISTGRGAARSLVREDATALITLANIKAVAPELSSRYQIVAPGTNTNTSVIGTTAAYPEVRNTSVAEGSFFSEADDARLAKVAVIGPTTRDDLFGVGSSAVGETIRINGLPFRVIGVTTAKGGSGFGNQDDLVLIPLNSAQKFLAGSDYLSAISLEVNSSEAMTQAQTDITNLLLEQHHLTDLTAADFSILNQNDIVATASSVTSTFTILLAAVAGISLVVGGIGIMNMMLTTITERTREIGLRKAIGATRRDINRQFLAEAVALTISGGGVGVVLGIGASWIIRTLNIIQTHVSFGSVLLAFSVSAAIGIVFGYYPARRAARLNPIEALRYE